jgi:hypothetical protein
MSVSTFDLANFKKALDSMIAKNENSYNDSFFPERRFKREYTEEEVNRIVKSKSIVE